jgi:hypothetical protein
MGKTYADIKKRKKPVVKKVIIALDGEKADEYNEARSRYEELSEHLKDDPRNSILKADTAAAKESLDSLKEEIDGEYIEFIFRSVGRRRYEEIFEECPPTAKQKQDAVKAGEDEPQWNPETFPPAIIAASVVEPEMTEEDVYDMWESEDWNQAELTSLFLAALTVNAERKVVDLGKESGQTTV